MRCLGLHMCKDVLPSPVFSMHAWAMLSTLRLIPRRGKDGHLYNVLLSELIRMVQMVRTICRLLFLMQYVSQPTMTSD